MPVAAIEQLTVSRGSLISTVEEAKLGPRGSEDAPNPGAGSKGFQEAGQVGRMALEDREADSWAEGPGWAESRSRGGGGRVPLQEGAAVSTGQRPEGPGVQGKVLGCDPGMTGGPGRASWGGFPAPKSDQACTPTTGSAGRDLELELPSCRPADPSYSQQPEGVGLSASCLRCHAVGGSAALSGVQCFDSVKRRSV